jgi:LysR family glycine cleavage system transcriptional activator
MSQRFKQLPAMAALRAFEAAARKLSFTEAAEDLGQTQGAVSHQIRELEARLGVMLFERKARGINLTELGERYLPYVSESLDRLRAGEAALRPQAPESVLTVSCSPNFAQKWLVPRLGGFSDAHPDIDLRISAALQHITFEGDGIDVAVRHGTGEWPELDVAQLCPETVFPVCSPHLPSSLEQVRSIGDLTEFVLLHDQDKSAWSGWLESVGANVDAFDLDRGSIFNQTSLVIDAAVAGQGIALARSALAELDLAAGRLIRPVAEQVDAKFAYWIVCPKRTAARPNIQRFRDWLLSQPAATFQ